MLWIKKKKHLQFLLILKKLIQVQSQLLGKSYSIEKKNFLKSTKTLNRNNQQNQNPNINSKKKQFARKFIEQQAKQKIL